MSRSHRPAVIVPCELHTADGSVLTGAHDLDLAWKWAEHENGDRWASLPDTAKAVEVDAALTALRSAANH